MSMTIYKNEKYWIIKMDAGYLVRVWRRYVEKDKYFDWWDTRLFGDNIVGLLQAVKYVGLIK